MSQTAIVADDEPLLRAELIDALKADWPELRIVASVGDGKLAVEAALALDADIAFLDIRMPRMSGLEAAAKLKGKCRVVFLTAYDEYAVKAFDHAAVDYLVKPLERSRLLEAIARLKLLAAEVKDEKYNAMLERLSADLGDAMRRKLPVAANESPTYLDWVKVAVGSSVQLIDVDQVYAFTRVPGYTCVLTHNQEALIKTPLKDLIGQLNPRWFIQVHRNAIVNLRHVASAKRSKTGQANVELRNGRGLIEVSRARFGYFRER